MDERVDPIPGIDSDDFPYPPPPARETVATGAGLVTLREAERRYIEHVLREVRGRQQRAARILGISRWSLARRLRKYGVPPRFTRTPPAAPTA